MKNNSLVRQIAEERISILYGLAEQKIVTAPELSHRYVSTLRKISSHYKISIPKKLRNTICTHCSVIMSPGINAQVRIVSSKGYIAYKCNSCGREKHIHY